CPVNIVLNHYAKLLGKEYDEDGILASAGHVNEFLMDVLNQLDFYKKAYPKSLAEEWVKSQIFTLMWTLKIDEKDILRTRVDHIAVQISKEINKKKNVSVLISGGGAYNGFLIKRLKSFTSNKILIPSKNIIEFKEALIFALLGVLRLRNEDNILKSVTGAIKNHSSGKIYHS